MVGRNSSFTFGDNKAPLVINDLVSDTVHVQYMS